jgi:4-aminobutyrate aminotransferase
LLILDEIPICMGRAGSFFAFQQYDIQPDILVIGKGLGAGLIPMAAMICRDEYNRAAHISLGHYTHEKNPLGSAAALAALDFMDENNVLHHVRQISSVIHGRLHAMMNRFEVIGQVRGMGLLWGVELVKSRETKERHPEFAEKVLYRCLEKGLSFKLSGGNVLSLYPPLIITAEELNNAMDILEEAVGFVVLNNL